MRSGAACTGSNLGKANRSLRLNLVRGKEREDPQAFPLDVSLLRLASHGGGMVLHLLGGCRLLYDRA